MSILWRGNPVGIHLIVNLYSIPDEDLLCYLWLGKAVLNQIVDKLNLHVVNESGHQFEPIGYTYAYILSESHFTIHTYPEYKSAFIDIFCCSKSFSVDAALNEIKAAFGTTTVTYEILHR
jgi:S-adenosylmethionine decarboxylase proenzyme